MYTDGFLKFCNKFEANVLKKIITYLQHNTMEHIHII
jgi:hypothetical protein